METGGWCRLHGSYPTLLGVDLGCPGCNQIREDDARRERANALRKLQEAEEAEEQRHRERLLAMEDERAAARAQERATRDAIAAADDRQRNAPRLLAEGEVRRAKECLDLGDFDACLRHATRAVDSDATFAPGRAIRAKVLHLLGDSAASIKDAEIAFKIAPDAVCETLADFHPAAAQLKQLRIQERLAADARRRTEAEQAQKQREVETQAAVARQAELERQAAAERQDALTERWRDAANRAYWSGFGKQMLVSLVAAWALYIRSFPHRWLGIVGFGGVVPWVSMAALTAISLGTLKIRPGSNGGDASASDAAWWKKTIGATAVISLGFVVASFAVGLWDAMPWLCPMVVGAVVWFVRWQPIRRWVATSYAPAEFESERAA